MDIDNLRLFVAACETRNLAKIAARENLSPATLTKRIQKLEASLGMALIRRVHRGIEPTPAGLLLLEKGKHLLGNFQDLQEMMGMYSDNHAGVVSVMGSYSMTAGRLTDDLAKFLTLAENKNIKIQLKEGDKQAIVDALRDGRVSLGVLWTATETSGLDLYPYHEDRAGIVVHADHPLAERSELAYSDIAAYETVRTHSTRKVELMLERAGSLRVVPWRNRIEVPSFETLLRMVRTARFAGLCPVQVAKPYTELWGLKVIPLSDAWAKRHHVIACQNSEILPPATRALLNHLRAQVTAPPML